MARIPDDELARVKRDVDLVALVRASGVELKPCGEDFRGLCPFHPEKTPSLSVSPKPVNLFRCFGCGAAGSVLDWVMRRERVSLPHAYEILRSLLGPSGCANPSLSTVRPGRTMSTVTRLPLPVARDGDDQRLLNDVAAFYHETLLGPSGEEARAYLTSRGLGSAELIERFWIGYANRTLGYRLPAANRANAGEVRRRLKALGIFREKSGREHCDGAVVFPVLAPDTRDVLTIYARKIHDDLSESCARHLYLKGPHRGVWNEEALATSKECVITEGIVDACTFWVNGYKSVVAAYGAEGVIADHFAAWKKYGTEKVLIAFDRDEAGDRAAEALAPRLAEAGIDVHRVLFPRTRDMKDANAFAVKVAASGASPAEALGEVLHAAPFVLKGKPSSAKATEGRRAEAEAPVMPSALGSAPAEEASSFAAAAATEDRSSSPLATPTTEEASAPCVEAATASIAEPSAEVLDETAAPPPAAEPAVNPSSAPDTLPLAAAAAPPEDPSMPVLSVESEGVTMTAGDRSYRVLDLWKNPSCARVEVTLRASRGEKYHADTFELQKARPREHFIEQAALEMAVEPEVVKKDLAHLLNKLEELLSQRAKRPTGKPRNVEIPAAEKEEAYALLKDPRIFDRIVEDLGIVGERTNKILGYLAATSRKMDDPLALLIQSNSAAGKSALMDAILEMMPLEEQERFTSLTAQSVYYLEGLSLKHRILAISEVEGAEKAGYPIKCLQSDGKISIATTVKDPETGDMRTKRHEVEGPVAIMLTTTEADVDEELQNRAIVLTVNEDREQTKAIHDAQRQAQTLEGMLARRKRQAVVRLHQNAQRLLRPLLVVNPFASELTFATSKLRTRRDHMKYLAMIRAVALLRQYQRPIRQAEHGGEVVSYIEVTREDIAIAHELANEVFGRSLDDLSPATRRLLELLDEMVSKQCSERKMAREDLRFSRREVREYTSWSEKTVRKHLDRLVELELVLIHRGKRGQSFVHELMYNGEGADGGRFAVGLADPRRLTRRGTIPTSCT